MRHELLVVQHDLSNTRKAVRRTRMDWTSAMVREHTWLLDCWHNNRDRAFYTDDHAHESRGQLHERNTDPWQHHVRFPHGTSGALYTPSMASWLECHYGRR